MSAALQSAGHRQDPSGLGRKQKLQTHRAHRGGECGGSLIAIHGRTKEQSYSGNANWDAIAEVKAAVKIPVIGNGDVKTVEDIERMKATQVVTRS